MTFVYLKEQQIADKAALDYLAIKNNAHSSVQLARAEKNLFDSLFYYMQFSTRKYFSCREDLKQIFCECVLMALKTFNPTIHDSFTYWLDGYLIKMKRFGRNNVRINQTEEQMSQDKMREILNTPTIFDAEPIPSPEKAYLIKEGLERLLERLSESDYQLLLIWLDSDSFEDAALKLNVSKQAVHSRVQKILEKAR